VITVAIPTYNRGALVADTVAKLFTLDPPPDEIVVVDQSRDENAALSRWHDEGRICLIRLSIPSIPHAMNEALFAATSPIILYLDDDVVPSPRLVAAHKRAHDDPNTWVVVGQVLQPGEEPEHIEQSNDELEFRFNDDTGRFVANVIANNMSVKRHEALATGGFDENFIGAAHRFESDFALRVVKAGGKIWFSPEATLRHLKLSSGGLRSYGRHLTSPSPAHSVGDYYFAMFHRRPFWRYALRRLRQNVATRFHLRHPWTIPAKLVGEFRGLLLGRKLARSGRRLVSAPGEMQPAAAAFTNKPS
jgi:GT2 family glycosyltransferase